MPLWVLFDLFVGFILFASYFLWACIYWLGWEQGWFSFFKKFLKCKVFDEMLP